MDQAPAPFCQAGDTDAVIIAAFRERFRTAPLGRWATDWSGTMDPFESLWFRADGMGVHAMQPGCDYEEVRFAWKPNDERSVRLRYLPQTEDTDQIENDWHLLNYDFEVRRGALKIDVLLVNSYPRESVLPWGFRFLDSPLIYVGGPDESEDHVRWSLWGGIRYFTSRIGRRGAPDELMENGDA